MSVSQLRSSVPPCGSLPVPLHPVGTDTPDLTWHFVADALCVLYLQQCVGVDMLSSELFEKDQVELQVSLTVKLAQVLQIPPRKVLEGFFPCLQGLILSGSSN